MGKKTIDFKTRHVASRGRKSKAGGGKKSKATQLYTPLKKKLQDGGIDGQMDRQRQMDGQTDRQTD